jgi:YidC/Oxa1 family membrane protein insertase
MAQTRHGARLARCAFVWLWVASSTTAFTTTSPRLAAHFRSASRTQRTTTTTTTTRRQVLPSPEYWESVATTLDGLVQQSAALATVHSSAQVLADAAGTAAPPSDDGGWWGAYIQLFKTTLNAVHSTIQGPLQNVGIEQSWGVSIAIFTTIVRTLLVPLSIEQSKSAEYIKSLKPYVADIKAKYKNNQEAQNRATAKLYEDAQQNPLAGCFVALIQLPVFLGLYRGVRLLAMDGVLEEPFLWIPSLEGPVAPPNFQGLDWLVQGWVNGAPALGWETTLAFLIMPVILVVLQSVTMQVLQPPVDEDATKEERETLERSQTILKFLPLLIGFFALQVPAGLTIYWFTSNIFTLTQSLAVRAYFSANPPQIELPDYWDTALKNENFENMTPEDRRKATEAGIRVGPSFDDLVDESRFHCLIERRSIREETEAWKRVTQLRQESQAVELPEELSAWVQASAQPSKSSTSATA